MKRLNDEKLIYICDRFFLGGPHTIRGFEQRGIGPQSDNQALGAQVKSINKYADSLVGTRKIYFTHRDIGLLVFICSPHCLSNQDKVV